MDASPHVLLVDDHRRICEPFAHCLKCHEVLVTVAKNAPTARRVLRAAAVNPVILDIMMPGKDGLALYCHLRKATRIPVILLTAMANEAN